MYQLSNEYKTQIKNPLRNPSYLKVDFTIDDPDAKGDGVLTSNVTGLYYSDLASTVYNFDVFKSYQTLEHNRFVLDGINPFAPVVGQTPYLYQGFIGSEISGWDCAWVTNPKIIVTFTTYFSFIGLTFNFDTIMGEYPQQVLITTYTDSTITFSQTVDVDKAENFFLEQEILNCNKIEVTAIKSTIPKRRFHLENIIFGIKKFFTDEDFSSAVWKRKVDLINSKLPTNTFDFTIIDIDKEYDPDNPLGIFAYIEKKQSVNFQLGYELESGSIEWQQCGKLFTNGEVKVESSGVIPNVTFSAIPLLDFMTDDYTEGVYASTPVSLYSLAEKVLLSANLPLDEAGNVKWSISTSLQSIYTSAPIPRVPKNVALQLIANAGMCLLNIDRNGNIVIEQQNTTTNDFTYTLADGNVPTTKKYPVLQGVDTSVTVYNVATAQTDLGVFDIVGATNTTFEFAYETATTITGSVGAGLTIVGTPQYFSGMCRIVLNGTGTFTVKGYVLSVKKDYISVEFNTLGERCPIENELITNRTHCVNYATWIGNYNNRRNEYEFENRGFPEVDCGDDIKIDTLFTEEMEVSNLESEITYNGTIRGKNKVVIK